MGKTKQLKDRKFDRSVEISAPILDPEVIKQIHSPPREQGLDVRHSGFKALLTDLNSQDSTDEVVPIMDAGHLPSYIGISCAVSGYSSYSAYNKRSTDEMRNGEGIDSRQVKITPSNRKPRDLSVPARSQNNSPTANRIDPNHIHHIKIDKSHINSVDEERKELTERLTASASERRRSPSPLAPIEDDRHHGAYVGARYCPMPPPSKLVHKHIPLLGIDDDQNPDEYVAEDINKVEKKIATLYGEDFVEDWKESMSHKSKKEHFEEEQKRKEATIITNPKDLVALRPRPVKLPEPEDDRTKVVIDVPTPNVKVLAGVEKQFLNRLLTDENPPMPKTPPSGSPISSPKATRSLEQRHSETGAEVLNSSTSRQVDLADQETTCSSSPTKNLQRSFSPPSSPTESPASPDSQTIIEPRGHSFETIASPTSETIKVEHEDIAFDQSSGAAQAANPEAILDQTMSNEERIEHSPPFHQDIEPESLIHLTTDDHQFNERETSQESLDSVESQLPVGDNDDLITQLNLSVQHIESEISARAPVDNQSSPVKVLETMDNRTLDATVDNGNLVSFSPEPSLEATTKLAEFDERLEDTSNLVDFEDNLDQNLKSVQDTVSNEKSEFDQPNLVLSQKTQLVEESKNENSGNSPTETKDNNNRDGVYYLNLLEEEESFINGKVKSAEATLAEHESDMDEDTLGRIRSAVGKANLLINKKCNQFRELCERGINRNADDQYAVLDDDLAGFWDMLNIQISDVKKSFETLPL